MKICLSALFLACAGALWCGCATPPATRAGAHPHAASAAGKTNAPSAASTNALVEGQTEEEGLAVPLPSGKGNPEALAHFAAGESLESTGRHEEAMEEFYKSVMADPGNEKSAHEVAEWLLEQQHPERAVTLLSKVALPSERFRAHPRPAGPGRFQAGKTKAALAASLQAIARQPDALQSYQSDWKSWCKRRKWPRPSKHSIRRPNTSATPPPQLIALANLYAACSGPQAKEKDPARLRAVALLDRASATKSTAVGLWQRLADAYARLNDLKKAADIYDRLLAQAVDSATLRSLLRERLGEILLDAHDTTNAAIQFQAIIKDDPVNYPRPGTTWASSPTPTASCPKPPTILIKPSVRRRDSNRPITVRPSSWPIRSAATRPCKSSTSPASAFQTALTPGYFNAPGQLPAQGFCRSRSPLYRRRGPGPHQQPGPAGPSILFPNRRRLRARPPLPKGRGLFAKVH